MKAQKSTRAARPAGPLLGVLAGGLLMLTAGAAWISPGVSSAEDRPSARRANPVRILPRRGRRGLPVDLPRGKHLLVGFLQQFADHTGETVYVVPDVPPDQTVAVDRSLSAVDAATAKAVLGRSRLAMSRETFRGREVYWVRRRLSLPRKRGGLVRSADPGEPGAAEPQPESAAGETDGLSLGGDGSVRVFRRLDGSRRSYLVTFETASREEAEEVARTVSLILSDRRRRQ